MGGLQTIIKIEGRQRFLEGLGTFKMLPSVVPRTPTSTSLMSSPSVTSKEAIFQVKQEDLEYQLLSPISTSSPGGVIRNSNGPRIIKVTPSALTSSKLMMAND